MLSDPVLLSKRLTKYDDNVVVLTALGPVDAPRRCLSLARFQGPTTSKRNTSRDQGPQANVTSLCTPARRSGILWAVLNNSYVLAYAFPGASGSCHLYLALQRPNIGVSRGSRCVTWLCLLRLACARGRENMQDMLRW